MSDLGIRNDFVEGTYEIFTTLFNDGVKEGINLYLLSDNNKTNVYGERKYKKYKPPIRLVSHAKTDSIQSGNEVEELKFQSSFTVPLKAFQQLGIPVDRNSLDKMRRGVIEFQGVFYSIKEVLPRVYVEDIYLFYHFICTEEKGMTSVSVEEV